MLSIHFANRHEDLSARLVDALQRPGGGLFTADEVIVPSAAQRRHLTLALADAHGVCAQVRFSYLAQWLWQQVGTVLASAAPDSPRPAASVADSPWQAGLLAWRVVDVLADEAWVALYPRLGAYLAQADAVTRFDLAQRVATLLDQTITFRPDWLAAWAEGRSAMPVGSDSRADEAWQAALWRRISGDLHGGAAHDGTQPFDPARIHTLANVLQQVPGTAEQAARLQAAGLPAAAHVFCLPTIAPVYLALLQQLGRWMDLHLYALNPCEAYWFDVVDRRRLAHLTARGKAEHLEVGHRLLAAWGQQAQAQLSGLVDTCGDAVIDEGTYTPHPAENLLGRLHNSILELTDLAPATVPLLEHDRSIEVHVAHSFARQLEILQDRLLALMAGPDAPAPGDILVVTPQLDEAAPLIDSVFGTAPPERALPYTLTGQAVSGTRPMARGLLALLAIAGGRATVTELFALLQQAPVARRFGLDDNGLQQVQGWLQQAGVHWGLDAAHRSALGLSDDPRHTLADGLHRLMLGLALPAPAELGGETAEAPFQGRLSAGAAEGTVALALGALWRFAQALGQWRQQVAQPQPPGRWPALLSDAVHTFLAPDPHSAADSADGADLRAAIQGLAEQWRRSGLAVALPLDVVQQALTQALDEPARGGVPSGRITFTSMSSLRGLPYRVVCILGLDDGAFPTADRPAEFDLLARHPRAGDRQRRTDERNLFLDLVLAARDTLHLSYTGRSVRDNAVLPPSVLVAELLDYLVPAIDAPAEVARAHLVVHHPLQAFDASLFDPRNPARQRSHHSEYALALAPVPAPAKSDTVVVESGVDDAGDEEDIDDAPDTDADDDEAAGPLPPFFVRPLPALAPEARCITLDQLQRFFRHPSRALLQRLGLRLRQPDEALDDTEPLLPSRRHRAALARRLLPAVAAGADDTALLALAEAGTDWPGGVVGAQALQDELPLLRAHAQALARWTATPELPPHTATLDLQVDGQPWQLQVALAGLRPDGLLRHRYADAGATDHIATWIDHLALCACAPSGVAGHSQWLGREAGFAFKPCDEPIGPLQTLLGLYAQGQTEPLYFFPKSAWAWAKGQRRMSPARSAWTVSPRTPYAEQADPAHRLVLRGLPDPMGDGAPRFEAAAAAVLDPLLARLDDAPT